MLPAFTGRGLGGRLLTHAVQRAWTHAAGVATRRVWVNTCTLDHPAALANYLARGFVQFREETKPRAPASVKMQS
jgi:GNAT superfamily N-acetyltransferase